MPRAIMALIPMLGSLTLGLFLTPAPPSWADNEGQMTEGAGFTMFDTESIKGSDEDKLAKDPICDRNKRPKITAVNPDEVKPGDQVTITGEHFGSKECFHGVSFSAASKTPVEYRLLNDTTIEAKVPEIRNGMTFVVVVAGGGSAQSKGVLVLPH